MADDSNDSRLYVGNIDQRITEATVIKLFSSFGKIVSENFLWHTRGPKNGEPRGYAFVQYGCKEEAQLAKIEMNGRMACGRPLVVRYASEKSWNIKGLTEPTFGQKNPSPSCAGMIGHTIRSAKVAAIKNKLKALEQVGCSVKKLKLMGSFNASSHDEDN